MERRTARAMGLSVALHVVAASGLFLIRVGAGEGPSRVSIIQAELLFDAGSFSSTTEADAERDGDAAARATPAPERPEPTDDAEPATDAEVAETHEPEPAERSPEPTLVVADAEHEADPAEVEIDAAGDSEAAVAATAPARAEADSPTESPAEADAESTAAPAGAAEVAEAAEPVLDTFEGDVAASTEAPGSPEAVVPGVPLETRERQMIAKRFASWNGRFTAGDGPPTVDWKQDGQAYKAVFRAPEASDPMGLERIVVDVTTDQGGRRMSTQLTMTRLAFSNFAQFVDKWDPNVQIHDDVIDGRFHSNTPINVLSSGSTSPTFRGKVTIASHDLQAGTDMPFNRRKVFPEGVDTGVRRIALPSRFLTMLNDTASADDEAAVHRFERDARVTFYADGTYGWAYVDGAGDGGGAAAAEDRRPIAAPAHYLVGLDDATLRIRGTVSGKVLVYSSKHIVIEGDVKYADPRSASADDYLGLVAELDVEIAEPKITGLGDLEIDGSIYARRRFAVRNYRSPASGTLVIYGSVTAGSITATEPRFATKIEFDRRLTSARPPSFPLTDRYELADWSGEWTADDPAAESAAADVDAPPDAAELDPAELDPAELDPAELDPAELDPAELDASASSRR